MHISLLVGGPEPKYGGDLNVLRYVSSILHVMPTNSALSLHIGTNKAPVPQRWDVAHPTEFQTVVDTFLDFLRTCYCKLPPRFSHEPH